MYRCIESDEIDIFKEPARLIIGGSSGSGKSFFISKLIRKYRRKFSRVIVIGSNLQNCTDLNIERNDTFDPFLDEISGNILIIYDDILLNKNLLAKAAEVFLRGRHFNFSVCLLTQNIFHNCKFYRTIALNCTHNILMRMRDIKQINCFGQTFLTKGEVEKFVTLYKRIVIREKYRYILIDFTTFVEDPLCFRSFICDESYEQAFIL